MTLKPPKSTTRVDPPDRTPAKAPPSQAYVPSVGGATGAAGMSVDQQVLLSQFGIDNPALTGGVNLFWDVHRSGPVVSDRDFESRRPVTVSEAVGKLSTMTPEARAQFGQQMWRAGYYPSAYYGKNARGLNFDTIDSGMATAFSNLMGDAIRNKAIGKGVLDLLAQRQGDPSIQKLIMAGADGQGTRQGRVGGGDAYTIQLDNPAAVRVIADRVGQETLGRKLTAAEHARVLARVGGEQRTQQAREIAAKQASSRAKFGAEVAAADNQAAGNAPNDTYLPDTTTTVFTAPADALAQDEVRRMAPVEAGAHDVASQFDTFLSLITGGAR